MLINVKAGKIRYVKILCIENKAGVRRRSPDAAAILQLFYKTTHSLDIVWSKFRVLKSLSNVLMCPHGLCSGARALTCPLHRLLRHWAQKQR